MKVRYYARRLFAFAAVVLATATLAPFANAGTIAYLKVDGGAWTALGASGTFTVGDIGATILLTPSQLPNQAKLFSATVTTNNTGPTAHDVTLVFVSDGPAGGFTSPTAPPAFSVKTVVSPTDLTGITKFSTAVDDSTAVHTFVSDNDQTGTSGGAPKILTATNQISPNPMTQAIGTPPNGTVAFGSIGSLSSGFTIGQELQFNIATGGSANLSITTTLAPEPGTMSLFAMGILGFGAYGWRRRRQTKATTETTVA